MSRFFTTIFLVVSLLIGSTSAAVRRGITELTVFGNLTSVNFENGGSEDFLTLAFGSGYFHSDEVEVGVQAIVSESSDLDLYSLGGNVKYHFTPGLTTIPYVGGQLNYSFCELGRRDEGGVMYGPVTGIRYFVSESTSIFFEYQYQIYDGSIDDIVDDAHSLFVGVLFKFE
jgi:hypothetical protein